MLCECIMYTWPMVLCVVVKQVTGGTCTVINDITRRLETGEEDWEEDGEGEGGAG